MYNGTNDQVLEAENKQPNNLTFIIVKCGVNYQQIVNTKHVHIYCYIHNIIPFVL